MSKDYIGTFRCQELCHSVYMGACDFRRAIDLAKEPCNSGFLINGLEFSRTTTPSGITIVGRANREQSALSRLQVSFNKL